MNGNGRHYQQAISCTSSSMSSSKSMPNFFTTVERLNRMQLSRVAVPELRRLRDALAKRVEAANAELVELLEQRDCLSMQRDALAVEVQDLRDQSGRRQQPQQPLRDSHHLQVQ